MILISLAVATVIFMVIMALIPMVYGNKQEKIYQTMQIKTSNRLLSNKKISEHSFLQKRNYKLYLRMSFISIVIS
jgi:flagellar basal body-associated protein FliL